MKYSTLQKYPINNTETIIVQCQKVFNIMSILGLIITQSSYQIAGNANSGDGNGVYNGNVNDGKNNGVSNGNENDGTNNGGGNGNGNNGSTNGEFSKPNY